MIQDDMIWRQASDLIAAGQTGKSLALLREHDPNLPDEARNELILFQARLNQLEKTERLLGQDVPLERQRLNKNLLDFIGLYETNAVPQAAPLASVFPIVEQRIQRLQQKIAEAYDLIEQWEEKRTLSENPTEQKRCNMEIARLRTILDQYLLDLESLSGK